MPTTDLQPHTSPAPGRPPWLPLAVLTALALAGNALYASMMFGVDFLFGGIAVLVAVRLYGVGWGMLVALLSSAYTFVLWKHPYAIVIFTAEAAFVGWLQKRRHENLPLLDGAYWLCVGMPLVWLFYRLVLHFDVSGTGMMMAKQSVNGVMNALVANLILTHVPLRRRAAPGRAHYTSLRQAVFNLLAAMVVFPALLLLGLDSRFEVRRIEGDAHQNLTVATDGLANRLLAWKARHERAVGALGRLYEPNDKRTRDERREHITALRQAFPDFMALYITNEDGVPMDNGPASGRLDAEHLTRLKAARGPVILGLMPNDGGLAAVAFGTPIFHGSRFLGCAVGVVDTRTLREALVGAVGRQSLNASLVDAQSRTVVSTVPGLRALEPYRRHRSGVLRPLREGSYQWLPSGPVPPVTAWRNSFYVYEAPGAVAPWSLVVETSGAPYQDYLQDRQSRNLAVVLVLSLLSFLVAAGLSRWLSSPLAQLAEITSSLPAHMMDAEPARWPESRVAEVSLLVGNFRSTRLALRDHFRQLLGANEALEDQQRVLARRNEELAEAHRHKDEFLAMLAHELRNPLSAVNNALYVLKRPNLEASTRQRSLDVLERQVGHQTRLVDDLLDVSRITRGKFALQMEPMDALEVVRNTVEDHRATLEAAGMALRLHTEPGPAWLTGDRTRLAQVVSNLVHNAVKFSEPGNTVRVEAVTDDGTLRFSVQDTGAGIAPDLLPRVFDAFTQGDRSLDRGRGGLGLGLALVKGIVERHGGTVEAHSEGLGHGATFTVRLPLEKLSATASPDRAPAGQQRGPLSILVVEDNADAAETLRDLLEMYGHTVRVAFTGPAGVAEARTFRPDVVLCDIGLPGMDGYGVACALRADPATAASRLIAISGYGRDEDRARSLRSGFDEHLIKPVDIAELRALLG